MMGCRPVNTALLDSLGADWTPHAAVPEGIAVENLRKRGFDFLRLRVRAPASDNSLLISATLVAAVLAAVAGYVFNLLSFAVPVGAAVAAVGGMALKSARRPKAWTITVLPDKLSITDGTFVKGEAKETVLPFSEIETVAVQSLATSGRSGHSLLIASAKTSAKIGDGLSADALRWLRSYLIMEITGLTWKPIFDVGRRTTRKRPSPTEIDWSRARLPKRIIKAFLDHAPQTMERLREAVGKQDAFRIKREAHWLKSSAANVGAAHFSELCQLMEIHALNNELQKTTLMWSDLDREFAALLETLKDAQHEAHEGTPAVLPPESLPRYNVRSGRRTRPADSPAGQPGPAPDASAPPVFQASILLVEDSPVNQAVAEEFLQEFGCEVAIANDGPAAIEACSRTPFDLVLMDCQMPEMDGFEATRRLRQREKEAGTNPVPIIALTANSLRGDRNECLAAGMDDYISKPYAPETILAMLEKWLPHKKVGPKSPSSPATQEDSPAALAEAAADAQFIAAEPAPAPSTSAKQIS